MTCYPSRECVIFPKWSSSSFIFLQLLFLSICCTLQYKINYSSFHIFSTIQDLQKGLDLGVVSPEILQNFFDLEQYPVIAELIHRFQVSKCWYNFLFPVKRFIHQYMKSMILWMGNWINTRICTIIILPLDRKVRFQEYHYLISLFTGLSRKIVGRSQIS